MPIFIRYEYQIAGEADIKRSMSSVAAHAERENARVLKSQARMRSGGSPYGAAANSNASIKEAERAAIAQMKASEAAEKKAAATAIREHARAEREKTKATERESKVRARLEAESAKKSATEASRSHREEAKITSEWARKQAQLKEQHIRDVARRERDEERATIRHRQSLYSTTRGVIGGTARTAANIGRGALAVAGLGGTALAANALHEGMATERSAAGLANQMAAAGESPEQIKKRVGDITKRAHEVKGFSSSDVIGSARAFGGISGNYQLGLDMTDQLAQIALATDVNLEEVSKVAGNAYMKLKVPGMSAEEAQSQTLEAVRTFAGQGNVGAVEIKDLAQYGGRLTAGAAKFQGTRLENMKQMGAMAQVAVGAGSATDAAEATEAAVRFASDLTRHAGRVSELSLGGKKISAFTDPGVGPGKNTQLRGIKDLVADVVEATGGSQTMMQEIFGERSAKITEAFGRMYTEAETANAALPADKRVAKGKAGRAAITAEFEKFDKAALTQKDQTLRAEAALQTTTAQLDEAMKKMNSALASELLPVMPGLIHSFAELAKPMSELIRHAAALASWLASNPLSGLSALISAAFLKELVNAKIGEAVKNAILGGGGGAGGGTGVIGGGGVLSAIAVGAATFSVASAILNIAESESEKKGERAAEQTNTQWEEYYKKRGEIEAGPGTASEKATKLEELAINARKNVELTRESLDLGTGNPAAEVAKNSSPEGFWGKLFKSMTENMGSPYATNPQFSVDATDSEKARNADKAAREFDAKLAEEQMKAAKMQQEAAKAMAANAGGSSSGAAPNRGNEPSKPTVK